MWNTGIFCKGGTAAPRKPLIFVPRIGGIIFYVKGVFCGYLVGPCGLKTPRETPEGMSGGACFAPPSNSTLANFNGR